MVTKKQEQKLKLAKKYINKAYDLVNFLEDSYTQTALSDALETIDEIIDEEEE